MESVSSGLLAGINAAKKISGEKSFNLPSSTIIGALANYVSDETVQNFQPMGANFGIISPLLDIIKDKKLRYNEFAKRSIDCINKLKV